jgi:hypothetical protein
LEKFAITALTEPPIRKSQPGVPRGDAGDVHYTALGLREHPPLKTRHAHAAEKLQRVAVDPGGVGKVEKVAGLGGAGIIDQDVTVLAVLAHRGGDCLAAGEFAQVGRYRHRFGNAWAATLGDSPGDGGEVGSGKHGGKYARCCKRIALPPRANEPSMTARVVQQAAEEAKALFHRRTRFPRHLHLSLAKVRKV